MRKLRHIITTALMALTLLTWSSVGWGQIISQYIDTYTGTSPKGIEIWNNTESTLDFSVNNLVVEQGTNGGAPTVIHTISSGTLIAGAVIVIGTSDMEATATGNGAAFSLKAFAFNGDDALVIKYGGTTTDVFGDPGTGDPGSGWAGNGVQTWDQNIQLISGITAGDTDGWTDPSARFETVSTDNTLTGFGLAPEPLAPDTDAPVPTFSPLDAANDVAIDVNPTITFDEEIYITAPPKGKATDVPVDNDNVESLITFTDGVDPVAFSATITGTVITVVPDAALLNEQAYTLTIAPVKDIAGNEMAAPATATFTTIAATAETIELTGDYTGPYYAGDEVTVTWTAANFDDVVVEAWVPSENEGAGGWVAMVATTPAVDGTASFTIPVDADYSAEYKMRVADVVDGDPSAETATFKVREVHTELATLRARPANTEARFDGSAIVTFARPSSGRNQKYVQDDVAAILIDDSAPVITEAYPIGSEITGLVGKISVYNAMVQFVPLEDPGAPASVDNPVTPFVTDLASITTNDQAKLIQLENITFTTFGTGVFVTNTNYTITDAAEATLTFRSSFSEVDYIDQDVPTNNIVEMLAVVNEFNGTMQIASRSMADWLIYSDDATLATFTLGGEDALTLTDVMVEDPAVDAGATLFVETLVDFAGIEVAATDEAAMFEVTLNDVVVDPADFATQVLDNEDVVVVTVTAEDGTMAYYKVTVMGDNRELTLTAPTGAVSLNTGEDLVVTWTSANIANVNIYAVDNTKAVNQINEDPIDATLGTYTTQVPNGTFGEFFIRIADAADPTFFQETETAVTVVDTQAPAGEVFSPEFGAVNLLRSFTISIEFDEYIAAGTGNLTIHDASDDAVVATITEADVVVVDNMVSADVEDLSYETTYYVLIDAGMVEDLAGNGVAAISDPTTWTFTTMDAPEMDLFISEYLEGSGNSKALEIFNPMDQAVDLSNYVIMQANNGSGWGNVGGTPDTRYVLPLTGTLEPGEVLVLANASSDPAVLAVADFTFAYDNTANGSDGSNVLAFNGDDAIGLFKNDVLIDVIGIPTEDPGTNWPVAGTGATSEYTLVRKGSVVMGNIDWAASSGTDANSSEWIVFPQNTFDYLGFHIAGLSDQADILTFTLDAQLEPAVIDATEATVTVEVLYGTSLASLTPSITISLGATIDPAGGTAIDFTNPVEYTVTAEDGSTKLWTVTVTEGAMSDQAEILTFVVEEAVGEVVIDSEAATIDLTVAVGTDIANITPSITISLGATISPDGGTSQDFTNPVVYTVTAQDGTTTKDWTVTVTLSEIISIYDVQYTDHPSGESIYLGEVVTTQGIVTAHHFNYEGGSFRGIFIQDGEGEWNGLYVYNTLMDPIPAVGDEITITGLIEEYYTLTELTTGGGTVDMIIETVSTGNDLPAPVVVTTAVAATEPYEGVLVKVENAEYTVEADNFNVLGVDDGSGLVYIDDDMHGYMDFMTLNASYNITGIGHFSYDLPKILPRFAEDIELVSSVKPIWGETIAAYPNPFTTNIWIDNAENASRVEVVNLIGQKVMSIELRGESRTTIQTENLPAGVYLVTLVNNQGQRTVRKMIKQ